MLLTLLFVFSSIVPSFATAGMSNFLVDNVQNALKFHKNGNILAALPLYEQSLVEKDSLNANIISTLASNAGSIYMSLGEYEKAGEIFEIAIEATPEKVESHFNYAIVLNSKLGDNGKALKHCAKAMQLDSNFYKAYHLMGNIMQDLGRPEKADDYFIKAENIAKSLGVEDPSLVRSRIQAGFDLSSLWMFQNLEVNKSYEIPIPPAQQEQHGRASMTAICLSIRPLVFEIPNLLSEQECNHIKTTATPKLELSHVMGSKVNTVAGDTEPYRSSYNAWLPLDPVLISLQERIALLTSLPPQYISLKSEELQVVKYETGGQFKMHHDSSAFNPRLLTALIYLQDSPTVADTIDVSTVQKEGEDNTCSNTMSTNGGETLFPFANVNPSPNSDTDEERSNWTVDDALLYLSQQQHSHAQEDMCRNQAEGGLAVNPAQGKAIIFFNHHADGAVDPLAVHSGSKLVRGTKWIANYWVALDMATLHDMPAAGTATS